MALNKFCEGREYTSAGAPVNGFPIPVSIPGQSLARARNIERDTEVGTVAHV